MPQLDIASFSTQYFWLVISFGMFFLSLVRWSLPAMTRVLAYRVHATTEGFDDTQEGNSPKEQSSHSLEGTEAFDAMNAAVQATHRESILPQDIEHAAYASAASTFQKAWNAECTLVQTQGVTHLSLGSDSSVLEKQTTRAFLVALQARLT